MKLGTLLLVVSLLVGAVGCSSTPSSRTTTIAALTGDTVAGKTIYATNCTTCHGADAKSGTVGKGIAAEDSNEAYGQIVSGGGGMPAFGSLSDQDIANLWAYVQTLK
jgi:cytochrome c551